MKRKIKFGIIFMMIFIVQNGISFGNEVKKINQKRNDYYEKTVKPEYEVVKAKIIEITLDETKEERKNIPLQSDRRYQHLKIKLLSSSHKGETYTVQNTIEMINPYKLIFTKKDKMLLRMFEDKEGNITSLQVYEKMREKYVYFAIIAFLILLGIIGGKNGIKSILSLIFTGLIICFALLPLILNGYNPILVSTIICIITTIITLILIVGKNRKAVSAILGTAFGLIISGLIVFMIGNASSLTGLGSEEAQMLAYIPQNINLDFKGILYAGILIGALGAIMDVTVSISSSMWEVENAHPKIKTKELIKSGLNVGKDIMGSMSNTLILAYTGGALHLMLLFNAFNLKFVEIVNMDVIASEIIRAIAGSIGLIMAIPLTAFISGMNRQNKSSKSKKN
ncbi:MAG: YibE/F family protein [Fusobacteriia bacterium 4572_132]|nr:MAG: YibE/F family protein [Fusobacteriia bacterium 4572_132]